MLTPSQLAAKRQARTLASRTRRKERRRRTAAARFLSAAAAAGRRAWLSTLAQEQQARAYVPPAYVPPRGLLGRAMAYLTRQDRGG